MVSPEKICKDKSTLSEGSVGDLVVNLSVSVGASEAVVDTKEDLLGKMAVVSGVMLIAMVDDSQ